MNHLRVVVNYHNHQNQFYVVSSESLPNNAQLKEMLLMATETVNLNVSNTFSSQLGGRNNGEKKFITDDEIRNFQVLKNDDREDLSDIFINVTLPGDEKKMHLVYEQFFKVLFIFTNATSYLLY